MVAATQLSLKLPIQILNLQGVLPSRFLIAPVSPRFQVNYSAWVLLCPLDHILLYKLSHLNNDGVLLLWPERAMKFSEELVTALHYFLAPPQNLLRTKFTQDNQDVPFKVHIIYISTYQVKNLIKFQQTKGQVKSNPAYPIWVSMALAELDCDPGQLWDKPAHPIPQRGICCDPTVLQEECICSHPACHKLKTRSLWNETWDVLLSRQGRHIEVRERMPHTISKRLAAAS